MLIDTHCHFNSLSLQVRQEVLNNHSAGFCFIDSSIDKESSKDSVLLSKKQDFIYTSLGFHPFCADKFTPDTVEEYAKLIDENKKIVSVGEIGLDFKAEASLSKQKYIFSSFIRLAQKKQLPVAIHNRLDNTMVLDVLDGFYKSYEKVIFHCFSYSEEFLDKIIERKGFVSFSLNILRKNKDIISSLKKCPVDNMLLETDSPYMKIKNIPSTPLDIAKVYQVAAFIKEIEQDVLQSKVYANASKVFSLN